MTGTPPTARARLRSRVVRGVRRSGLLPSSWPDRLGDEERLAEVSLDQQVLVYFPDTRDKLYQLRQWYAPLRALDARHPVVVVGQDSRAMATVREESGLIAVTIARYDFLADLLDRSTVKAVFYVNHSPQNFSVLRFPSLAHVYLSHGDSDKGVSVSNQAKAYDFLFVAGQAAVDRMAGHLMFTDLAARCIPVGRPELDAVSGASATEPHPGHPRVLYAPTWEGAQPSMAYGSVATHGREVVRALVGSGRFAVTYRPHPMAGRTDREYAAADLEVRGLIERAQHDDPAAGHRVDTSGSLPQSFVGADVLVCDVSSVAMDWLTTRRPVIVTVPASGAATTASTRLLDLVPRLAVPDIGDVVDLVSREVEQDPQRAARLALVDYYLGDTSPGAATARFLDACSHVLAQRDKAWAEVSGRP